MDSDDTNNNAPIQGSIFRAAEYVRKAADYASRPSTAHNAAPSGRYLGSDCYLTSVLLDF